MGLAFSRNYPNVRTLDICQGSGEWIKQFGARLETLRLHVPPHIFLIEYNCPGLRHIKLTLSASYENELAMSPMWEKIGESLASVTLEFGWDCGDEVKKIEKYCRALKRIEISRLYEVPMQTLALLHLLSSYGHNWITHLFVIFRRLN